MSTPIKHHYLPEFYIRRWAAPDGRVVEYRKPHIKLTSRWAYPSETGFEKELYAVKTRSDPVARQALELQFMSPVDNWAAKALDFLEANGSKPPDPQIRDGWTRFIMSLLHRAPQRLDRLRKMLQDYNDESLAELAPRYAELRGPNDPPTFEEYLKSDRADMAPEFLAKLLPMIVDSKRIGETINAMSWRVVRLPDIPDGFVTSDLPIMMSNGLGHARSFMILPIGPAAYFICGHRPEIINSLVSQTSAALELGLNDAVVRQAKHIVVASDKTRAEFISERFLTGEEPQGELGMLTWDAPLIDIGAVNDNQ